MRRHSPRGGTRRNTGTLSKSLFRLVLALAAGRPYFNARNVTIVAGKVVDIHDWSNDAHVLTQSDSTKQCDTPAPHADFANQLCFTFTSPELKNYSSNLPGAVDWMHDGTGGEFFLINTPTAGGTMVPLGSRNTSGRGFTFGRSASPASFFYVLTAGNSFVIQQTDPTNSWAQDVPTYLNASYAISSTPDATVRRRSTVLTSGNQAISPESGASSQALRLGTDGSNYYRGRIAEIPFFTVLAAAQRSFVQQYLQQTFGIAP